MINLTDALHSFRIAPSAYGYLACLMTLIAPLTVALSSQSASGKQSDEKQLVYVGTNGPDSKGIYAYRFEDKTGEITSLGLAVETPRPFWLTASRDSRYLYVANILDDYQGQNTGSVSAFSIDVHTGKLTLLNQVSSHGAHPCYVALDHTGRFLLVANYTGGTIAVFPVHSDGSLGEACTVVEHKDSGADPSHPRTAHPHEITVTPDNRFVLVTDLGLDKLYVYSFNSATGSLTPSTPPFAEEKSHSGPRHFVFSASGRTIYVMDETASTITVFSYNPDSATLQQLQVISALPEGFAAENTGAEIALSHDGKFLYSSNRGNDTIAVYSVSASNHTVTPIDHVPAGGKTPGMFAVDPSGHYMFVANDGSDNVVIFRIDPHTGRLAASGKSLHVPHPACVFFLPIS